MNKVTKLSTTILAAVAFAPATSDAQTAKEAEAKTTASQLSISASVKRETQDNVHRIEGFDIEFYKKLNPDDFSATDVPAIQKLFKDICKQTLQSRVFRDDHRQAGGDYRTFKLTVIEEPRQRPFEDLNANEGALGGTWYTGARWRLNLHEDGLNDYLTVIVPKLRAVLSKVAVKTSEQDIVYTVISDTHRAGSDSWPSNYPCLLLKSDLVDELTSIPDGNKMNRICLAIPGDPEKLLNPKEGDKIPVKYINYDLFEAFGSAIATVNAPSVIWFYQHACTRNGAYLETKSSASFETGSPFGTDKPNDFSFTAQSIYEHAPYHWLLYFCPSVMSFSNIYIYGIPQNIPFEQSPMKLVIQVEGQLPTFSVKDDNYGSVLVNFRSGSEMKKTPSRR